MGKLGYLGFTINIIKRTGKKQEVLIWAASNFQVLPYVRLVEDSEHLLALTQEDNKFAHYTEVWDER